MGAILVSTATNFPFEARDVKDLLCFLENSLSSGISGIILLLSGEMTREKVKMGERGVRRSLGQEPYSCKIRLERTKRVRLWSDCCGLREKS